jgi:TonB family protein
VSLVSAAIAPFLALWSPRWSILISIPVAADGGTSAPVASIAWPQLIEMFWTLGVLVMMLRAAGGWLALFRLRRRSEYFLTRDARAIRIADVSTPLACGVLRPMILLPASAREWDESRLHTVLLHESTHVLRRDCLSRHIAQAARALLWWNPLAWILAARVNREQELACDAAVLAAGVPADSYANMLLDLVRESSRPPLLGCAMAGGAALQERFAHLFGEQRRTTAGAKRVTLLMPALLLGLTALSLAQNAYKIGPGIVPPKVLQKSEPKYTAEARAKKISGTVSLTIIVGTDHRAHDIKITKSLDPGLDKSAINSIRTWRFQPGTKDGKPVPVVAKLDVNFRLN